MEGLPQPSNSIKATLKQPAVFDDGNLFDPQAMADAGFEYCGIGRSAQH
jgi:UDPglucose 6-dehydrogenase